MPSRPTSSGPLAFGSHQITVASSPPVSATPSSPIVNSKVTEINFNPFWTVPQSISGEEYLPMLRRDPNALAAHGFKIFSSWSDNDSELDPTTVDWNRVIFKSLTIKGIYGREMFETWYKMIAMLQSGLDVRKVITHRMKAEDFAQGFALMKQGSCGKVVLDWGSP